MKERIEELAEQNGFIHVHMSVGERNDALRKFQKFAELIVRECANIAFDAYAKTNGAESGESAILKHFGVEE
jgi:hypothetical protein